MGVRVFGWKGVGNLGIGKVDLLWTPGRRPADSLKGCVSPRVGVWGRAAALPQEILWGLGGNAPQVVGWASRCK